MYVCHFRSKLHCLSIYESILSIAAYEAKRLHVYAPQEHVALWGCMLQSLLHLPLSWMAVKMAHWPRVNRSSNRRQKSTRHMARSVNHEQYSSMICAALPIPTSSRHI